MPGSLRYPLGVWVIFCLVPGLGRAWGGLRKGLRIHTRTRCRVRRVHGVVAGGDVKSPPSSREVMECLRG